MSQYADLLSTPPKGRNLFPQPAVSDSDGITVVSYTQTMARRMWEVPRHQEGLRRDMLISVVAHAAREGLLLTEWPTETLRYLSWEGVADAGGPGREISKEEVEAGVWDAVSVTLSAPSVPARYAKPDQEI